MQHGRDMDSTDLTEMQKVLDFIGADGGTRTLTGNHPRDFKSLASTIPPRPRGISLTAPACGG